MPWNFRFLTVWAPPPLPPPPTPPQHITTNWDLRVGGVWERIFLYFANTVSWVWKK